MLLPLHRFLPWSRLSRPELQVAAKTLANRAKATDKQVDALAPSKTAQDKRQHTFQQLHQHSNDPKRCKTAGCAKVDCNAMQARTPQCFRTGPGRQFDCHLDLTLKLPVAGYAASVGPPAYYHTTFSARRTGSPARSLVRLAPPERSLRTHVTHESNGFGNAVDMALQPVELISSMSQQPRSACETAGSHLPLSCPS